MKDDWRLWGIEEGWRPGGGQEETLEEEETVEGEEM